jgi:colanic acid biosynthesis glycosyl transferase WcaI
MSRDLLLFISPFYKPELISTGKYNTALVAALVARGQRVRVLTGYPTYPNWQPKPCSDFDTSVEVVRGGLWLRYPRSPLLRRLLLEVWFFIHVVRHFVKWRREISKVVCVMPPSIYVFGVAWLMPSQVECIGIVHDLQGVHAAAGGHFRRLLAKIMSRLEGAVFRRFSLLIFLSESMLKHASTVHGIRKGKSRVCYPFVTTGDTAAMDGQIDCLPEGMLNVVYSGALGEKQNPDLLYRFMDSLATSSPGVMCHIFSGGPDFERLRTAATPNPRLRMHDLVPEEQLINLYRRSDIQIIPQATRTGHGSLPSKLPNLVTAGCYVLAICDADSELARLVNRMSCGSICPTWAIEEMLNEGRAALRAVRESTREERVKVGQPWVDTLFSRDILVEDILAKRSHFS